MADDAEAKTGKYPQINVNTAVSFGVLMVIVSGGVWLAGIKSEVEFHGLRLTTLEANNKDLRSTFDTSRLLQAQSETRLENRLTRMEIMLQDVLSRLARPPSPNP